MLLKRIITAALLVFVAASLVKIGFNQFGPRAEARDDQPSDKPIADGVIVYYLHGNTRCPTCKSIEAAAHEAVHDGFAEKLKSGQLQWLMFNFDEPQHAHFKKDYGIEVPMVVLVRRAQGEDAKFVALDEVWPLICQGDQKGCVAYVQRELTAFLQSNP
jgi:hypothetical protein